LFEPASERCARSRRFAAVSRHETIWKYGDRRDVFHLFGGAGERVEHSQEYRWPTLRSSQKRRESMRPKSVGNVPSVPEFPVVPEFPPLIRSGNII